MSKDKVTEKTNDYESLRAQLSQNLSSRKIVEIMQKAGELRSKEEADEILSMAKAKLGNDKDNPPPPHHHHHEGPEADLVADGGFKGYGKNQKNDELNDGKAPGKAKGKAEKFDDKKEKPNKSEQNKEELKKGNFPRDEKNGNNEGEHSEKTGDSKRKPPALQILEFRKNLRELKDVYKDDPLKAFEEMAKQKPDAQAPFYVLQKYEAERTELLHDVDERIKTSPEGTKYSPEKLGEELYKYQSNAETKAFADDVLKNNQNNQELQESYKEAANKTPQSEEQKTQENEQAQTQRFHRLRKFWDGQKE